MVSQKKGGGGGGGAALVQEVAFSSRISRVLGLKLGGRHVDGPCVTVIES